MFIFLVEDGWNIPSGLVDFLLAFELPKNFNNPEKYDPWAFDAVPQYISEAVFAVLGIDVPLDPQIILVYLRNGQFPHYVIDYIVTIQKKKNLAIMTSFFRVMWLVHRFCEHIILPPVHFLSQFDTAAVQSIGRLAGDDNVVASVSGTVEAASSSASAATAALSSVGNSAAGTEEGATDDKALLRLLYIFQIQIMVTFFENVIYLSL